MMITILIIIITIIIIIIESFDELLGKDKSISIHQRNLQLVATEIFKVKNGTALELKTEIFEFVKTPSNLRHTKTLHR